MINQTAPDTSDETEEILGQNELEDIKKKSISGVFSFFLRSIFLQGIGFASIVFLSHFFSPEDFGVYGFVIQIIGILIFFSDIGLAAALIQKKGKVTLTDYRTAFTIQQALSWAIVMVVLAIISTGFVADKVGDAGVWILITLGLSFPLATLQTISRIRLERKLDFSKLVIPQIFEQIVFHGLLIFLAWQGKGAISYAYAIMARSIVGAVVMFVIEPWSIGLAWSRDSFNTLVKFGVKFQLNDFLARIKDQLFFLVLGAYMLPLREFGYVNWAKNWSLYPYTLTVSNVMAITFPTFSRLQAHPQALKRAIEKSLFFISLFIFPLLVGMSVFVTPLVELVDKYQKWQPALFSLILFSLSIGWGAISTPLTNTLNAIGHINTTLKLMVIWTVLTWVVTPIAVWYFGFNGVAIASFLISFTSVLSIYYVKKVVPIDAWGHLKYQVISATVMAGVGWGLIDIWSQSFAWLGTGMAVTGIAYAGTMIMTGRKKLWAESQTLLKRRK
jgi:O-antigen/teichoic acid export membrane protein